MKRAGTVVRTAQGLLVLRRESETHPDIGTRVLDDQLQDVGHVVDIFGPVDSPYVAVTPDGAPRATLVGETLYYRSEGD